jgi:hypothetical protein
MMIEGAFDTQVFDLYVEHFLVPSVLEGDIVILDNVKFHHSQRAADPLNIDMATNRLRGATFGRLPRLPHFSVPRSPV